MNVCADVFLSVYLCRCILKCLCSVYILKCSTTELNLKYVFDQENEGKLIIYLSILFIYLTSPTRAGKSVYEETRWGDLMNLICLFFIYLTSPTRAGSPRLPSDESAALLAYQETSQQQEGKKTLRILLGT